jgi:hypothetical protein
VLLVVIMTLSGEMLCGGITVLEGTCAFFIYSSFFIVTSQISFTHIVLEACLHANIVFNISSKVKR